MSSKRSLERGKAANETLAKKKKKGDPAGVASAALQANVQSIVEEEEVDIKLKSTPLHDAVKTEFECSICQDIVIKAHGLTCAHLFCEYCIKRWLTKNAKCPFCREKTRSSRVCPVVAVDKVIEKYFEDQAEETKEERKKNVEEREKCRDELDKMQADAAADPHRHMGSDSYSDTDGDGFDTDDGSDIADYNLGNFRSFFGSLSQRAPGLLALSESDDNSSDDDDFHDGSPLADSFSDADVPSEIELSSGEGEDDNVILTDHTSSSSGSNSPSSDSSSDSSDSDAQFALALANRMPTNPRHNHRHQADSSRAPNSSSANRNRGNQVIVGSISYGGPPNQRIRNLQQVLLESIQGAVQRANDVMASQANAGSQSANGNRTQVTSPPVARRPPPRRRMVPTPRVVAPSSRVALPPARLLGHPTGRGPVPSSTRRTIRNWLAPASNSALNPSRPRSSSARTRRPDSRHEAASAVVPAVAVARSSRENASRSGRPRQTARRTGGAPRVRELSANRIVSNEINASEATPPIRSATNTISLRRPISGRGQRAAATTSSIGRSRTVNGRQSRMSGRVLSSPVLSSSDQPAVSFSQRNRQAEQASSPVDVPNRRRQRNPRPRGPTTQHGR